MAEQRRDGLRPRQTSFRGRIRRLGREADSVKKLFTGYANAQFPGASDWSRWAWMDVYGARRPVRLAGFKSALTEKNWIDRPRFRASGHRAKSNRSTSLATGRVRRLLLENGSGCDNSTLARHFPLPDHYRRRNPTSRRPPSASIPGQRYQSQPAFSRQPESGSSQSPESANHPPRWAWRSIATNLWQNRNALVCEPAA